MRISDWSSDVCSSDLVGQPCRHALDECRPAFTAGRRVTIRIGPKASACFRIYIAGGLAVPLTEIQLSPPGVNRARPMQRGRQNLASGPRPAGTGGERKGRGEGNGVDVRGEPGG